MALIKYETHEVMPMVVMVLNFTASEFLFNAVRIAQHEGQPGCAAISDEDRLQYSTVDTLNRLDSPIIKLMIQCADAIMEYCKTVSMLHAIELAEYDFLNPEIGGVVEKAHVFHNKISFYCDGGEPSKGPKGDLYRYTFSVDHIIFHLCKLILFDKLNLRNHSFKRYRRVVKADFSVFNAYDRYDLRLLVNLGLELNELCDQIVAIVGIGRWRRLSDMPKKELTV